LQGIIAETMLNTSSWPDYIFTKGVLRYKYIIVIRRERNLRDILVSTTHDSYIEDHNNIYNSYKNLKSILY
jgi:hypothetical protein